MAKSHATKILAVASKVLILTFSYFLNHIQPLISKNPNLPSTNHQHSSKLLKTAYIYIYRERERERERETYMKGFPFPSGWTRKYKR